MDIVRMLLGAFAVTALLIAGVILFDPSTAHDQVESVRQEVRKTASALVLNQKIDDLLKAGAIDDAVMYAEITAFAGYSMNADVAAALARETTGAREMVRNAGAFAAGFATGEADSVAALAGAVTADLTVVGDLRDIASEGAKMVTGEDYNELILGLSAVGIALTSATLASGGAALPAKAGVSVLKVAKRAGHLTDEFGTLLGRMVHDAVNPDALNATLRNTRLTDPAATRIAVQNYASKVRTAEIFPTLVKIERIREAAGAGEAVRLMRYVRNAEDLDNLTDMSRTLGKKTRGVIELTGKTSLRLFKSAFNLVALIVENILSLLSWLGSLAGMMFTRRALRLLPI